MYEIARLVGIDGTVGGVLVVGYYRQGEYGMVSHLALLHVHASAIARLVVGDDAARHDAESVDVDTATVARCVHIIIYKAFLDTSATIVHGSASSCSIAVAHHAVAQYGILAHKHSGSVVGQIAFADRTGFDGVSATLDGDTVEHCLLVEHCHLIVRRTHSIGCNGCKPYHMIRSAAEYPLALGAVPYGNCAGMALEYGAILVAELPCILRIAVGLVIGLFIVIAVALVDRGLRATESAKDVDAAVHEECHGAVGVFGDMGAGGVCSGCHPHLATLACAVVEGVDGFLG